MGDGEFEAGNPAGGGCVSLKASTRPEAGAKRKRGEDLMSSALYPNPQAIFYQQYESVRRDEVVGILLALFLGGFGVHHFYLRRIGWGGFYCCLCWAHIP